MKNDPLNQFINLRKSLLEEKATHLARLVQIDKALGTPTEATEPVALAPTLLDEPASASGKPKRKVSKASRAKMAAAQKARWAKTKAPTQPEAAKPAPAALPAQPALAGDKPKRKVSKASRAKMAAAQKARWAKTKAPAQPAEPLKKKELTVSAESKPTGSKTAKARRAKKKGEQK